MDFDKIESQLERMQESRDTILGQSRRIISMCSRAIMAIHRGQTQTAAGSIREAASLLVPLRQSAHPRTAYHLITAEQEFVEATALLCIIQDKDIPSSTDLDVMPESYVLGMMDVIGELRRLMLDQMRAGLTEKARRTFDVMDSLYGDLYIFASYDKILKESRRKLDVCRAVLEASRTAITEERRREEFSRTMKG